MGACNSKNSEEKEKKGGKKNILANVPI